MSAKFALRKTAKGLMIDGEYGSDRLAYAFRTGPEKAVAAIIRVIDDLNRHRSRLGIDFSLQRNMRIDAWNGDHFVARLRLKESHDGRHRLVCERFWGGLLEGEVGLADIEATITAQPILYAYRDVETGTLRSERYFTRAEAIGSAPWSMVLPNGPIELLRLDPGGETVVMGEIECARYRRARRVRTSPQVRVSVPIWQPVLRLIKNGKLDDYPFVMIAPAPIGPVATDLGIRDAIFVRTAPRALAVQSEKSLMMLMMAVPGLELLDRERIDRLIRTVEHQFNDGL